MTYKKPSAYIFTTLILFLTCTNLYAESVLRIVCHGSNASALIYVNGKASGSCPMDLFVPAGRIELKAVKVVDSDHERVFENSFSLEDDSAKKIKVQLSNPQLTAAAQKRRTAEKQKKEQALAADALTRARKGDINAMHAVSQYYRQGQGLEISEPKALYWENQAQQAQLSRDLSRAAMATLKAAEAGDTKAMAEMSLLYTQGKGVKQDSGQAKAWADKKTAVITAKNQLLVRQLLISALSGDIDSMTRLSTIYKEGATGVIQSDEKSAEWADKKAQAIKVKEQRYVRQLLALAESGDIDAMTRLSTIYKEGAAGVIQSDEKSLEWERKISIVSEKKQQFERAKQELNDISYVNSLGAMEENGLFDNPLATTITLPLAAVADLMSTPFNLTNHIVLQREVNAQAADWEAPESMIAKAYQQKYVKGTSALPGAR